MKKINFKLFENNQIIIKADNLNCINKDNSIIFIIDGIKYKYTNNIFIKDNKSEIITLDFLNNNCKIELIKENLFLNMKIEVIENKILDNIINIKYKTELDYSIVYNIVIEIY